MKFPEELDRFIELPMRVKHENVSANDVQDGGGKATEKISQVLSFVGYDNESKITHWRLADVRLNRERKGKGRRLNKRERETLISIGIESIEKINLHLDI